MIGANAVAKSAPDGYTILMGHVNSNAIAPNLVDKPLYDPLKDFAQIAYVGYDGYRREGGIDPDRRHACT